MTLPIKAAIAIALLWAAVGITFWAAGRAKATPEKIAAYLEKHPLSEVQDEAEREKLIRKVANQVNQLDYEQRQAARDRENPYARDFFENLSPDERALFVELTIGPTFDHMMRAFNAMEPEARRQIAQRTIRQLKEGGRMPEREAEQLEEGGVELFERVTKEGLRAFYQEASADTKIDFAPVLEEMQRVLRSPRMRRPKPKEPAP